MAATAAGGAAAWRSSCARWPGLVPAPDSGNLRAHRKNHTGTNACATQHRPPDDEERSSTPPSSEAATKVAPPERRGTQARRSVLLKLCFFAHRDDFSAAWGGRSVFVVCLAVCGEAALCHSAAGSARAAKI